MFGILSELIENMTPGIPEMIAAIVFGSGGILGDLAEQVVFDERMNRAALRRCRGWSVKPSPG